MQHADLLDALASAELEFAHFNARRTCASPTATIALAANQHLQWLTDSSRPSSGYYNRAIAQRVGDFPIDAMAQLPGSVAAIELRPREIQPNVSDALLGAGFRPVGALCYLAMRAPIRNLVIDHHVRRLGEAETDVFFDLLESTGTPFPAERRAAKRQFYCTDSFQVFIAEDTAGEALGWSTMFHARDFAFLGNSYTRPEARGRGVHSALLAARLNAAADANVRHVFTDVEHGSQSHANCERVGLRTATLNVIWQKRA